MASKQVLSSYLKAFRATRFAFKGDLPVLAASREKIRTEFRKPINEIEIPKKLKEMDSVSTFLLRNIVQAKKIDPAQEKYQLQIHKHTELGNNDSIKKVKKVLMDNNGGCCGGSNAKI